MKRVSFKVAKAIKEAGYPQECDVPCYITETCVKSYDADYDGDMPIVREKTYTEEQYFSIFGYSDKDCNPPHCYAPTYIDVWLWLWREKKCNVTPIPTSPWDGFWSSEGGKYSDPEAAIVAAIDYLAENNLISNDTKEI